MSCFEFEDPDRKTVGSEIHASLAQYIVIVKSSRRLIELKRLPNVTIVICHCQMASMFECNVSSVLW